MRAQRRQRSGGDPLWFKDAVIYEVHVRAFFDGNDDGCGDFAGLTRKLEYIQDLGVNTVWLLPFYPSPGRDDGYDIADYRNVHPRYGTRAEFRAFVREAHRRNLRVITELVLNHTSDAHPWFQAARRAAPGSLKRDYYVWSDTPERYAGTRIIFRDTETSNWAWDPQAQAYYWHRFFSHQPDLNFDNPHVLRAMLRAPATRTCARPTKSSRSSAARSPANTRIACCWPRPTSGPRTFATISATAWMSARWPITSR